MYLCGHFEQSSTCYGNIFPTWPDSGGGHALWSRACHLGTSPQEPLCLSNGGRGISLWHELAPQFSAKCSHQRWPADWKGARIGCPLLLGPYQLGGNISTIQLFWAPRFECTSITILHPAEGWASWRMGQLRDGPAELVLRTLVMLPEENLEGNRHSTTFGNRKLISRCVRHQDPNLFLHKLAFFSSFCYFSLMTSASLNVVACSKTHGSKSRLHWSWLSSITAHLTGTAA